MFGAPMKCVVMITSLTINGSNPHHFSPLKVVPLFASFDLMISLYHNNQHNANTILFMKLHIYN